MNESLDLTKRQLEILNFIKKYISINGYSPSIREICKGNNISSSSTVFSHIKTLVNKGYIKKTNNKFRTIEIINNELMLNIPLIHEFNLLNNDYNNIDYIKLSNKLFNINKDSFILKITNPSSKYYNQFIIYNTYDSYNEKDLVVALVNEEIIINYYNTNINKIYGKVISIINNIK